MGLRIDFVDGWYHEAIAPRQSLYPLYPFNSDSKSGSFNVYQPATALDNEPGQRTVLHHCFLLSCLHFLHGVCQEDGSLIVVCSLRGLEATNKHLRRCQPSVPLGPQNPAHDPILPKKYSWRTTVCSSKHPERSINAPSADNALHFARYTSYIAQSHFIIGSLTRE